MFTQFDVVCVTMQIVIIIDRLLYGREKNHTGSEERHCIGKIYNVQVVDTGNFHDYMLNFDDVVGK